MSATELNDIESLQRMIMDVLEDHPKGAAYSYLKNQITLYRLLPSHLSDMESAGLIYRAPYKDRKSIRYRLTRKATQND